MQKPEKATTDKTDESVKTTEAIQSTESVDEVDKETGMYYKICIKLFFINIL